MLETYKVGVSLVLQNGVSGVLAITAKDLLGIHGSVKSLTKEFDGFKGKIVAPMSACEHLAFSSMQLRPIPSTLDRSVPHCEVGTGTCVNALACNSRKVHGTNKLSFGKSH